jgi:hypothetical protein
MRRLFLMLFGALSLLATIAVAPPAQADDAPFVVDTIAHVDGRFLIIDGTAYCPEGDVFYANFTVTQGTGLFTARASNYTDTQVRGAETTYRLFANGETGVKFRSGPALVQADGGCAVYDPETDSYTFVSYGFYEDTVRIRRYRE